MSSEREGQMTWYLSFTLSLLHCYIRLLWLAHRQPYGGTLREWWQVALAGTQYSFALQAEDWWAKGRSVDWHRMTKVGR